MKVSLSQGWQSLVLTILVSLSGQSVRAGAQPGVGHLPNLLPSLLKDGYGRTLYVFDPDQGQNGSVCNGDCAEKWPPYLVTDKEITQGVAAPYAVIARSTGLKQLTFSGRPLYLFFADRVPNDTKGNGLGGVWHVVPLASP